MVYGAVTTVAGCRTLHLVCQREKMVCGAKGGNDSTSDAPYMNQAALISAALKQPPT